jgi:hypothetical protein
MPKVDIREWDAQILRVTAFPRDPMQPDQLPGWSELLGVEPEIAQTRPREAVRVEAGPYQSGWLALEASPVRIDWKFSSYPDQTSASKWASVGDLAEAERLFIPHV